MHARRCVRWRQTRGDARIGRVITQVLMLAALVAAPAADAYAQGRSWRSFVRVNRANQMSEIADRFGRVTQQISRETAIYEATHSVGDSDGLDVSAGVRVFRNLAVGVGVTSLSTAGNTAFRSWVPDPVVGNRFEPGDASRAFTHRQTGYHVQATWVIPVGGAVDIALFGGPSFFELREESAGEVALFGIADPGHDATTTAVGGNAGVDITVRFGPYVGVGAQIGWTGASALVDLPWRDESQPITLGGVQAGGGLRLRF